MDEQYEFGPFRLDCSTRTLWRGDDSVALTPKAFDLLRVLVMSGGRVREKQALLNLLWPGTFVGEDSLTQCVAALRRALGDSADHPAFIATVPRHGYRFVPAVRTLSRTTSEAAEPVARVRARYDFVTLFAL